MITEDGKIIYDYLYKGYQYYIILNKGGSYPTCCVKTNSDREFDRWQLNKVLYGNFVPLPTINHLVGYLVWTYHQSHYHSCTSLTEIPKFSLIYPPPLYHYLKEKNNSYYSEYEENYLNKYHADCKKVIDYICFLDNELEIYV